MNTFGKLSLTVGDFSGKMSSLKGEAECLFASSVIVTSQKVSSIGARTQGAWRRTAKIAKRAEQSSVSITMPGLSVMVSQRQTSTRNSRSRTKNVRSAGRMSQAVEGLGISIIAIPLTTEPENGGLLQRERSEEFSATPATLVSGSLKSSWLASGTSAALNISGVA